MKKAIILIILLVLIAGCTKVKLNSDIKETVQGVPDHGEANRADKINIVIEKITNITKSITNNEINQSETDVESFGDVV